MQNAITVWAPIPGYEGFYEVSACGLVRSLGRQIYRSTGAVEERPGRVMRQHVAGKGYQYVTLSVNGVRAQVGVHRLVALAFLGLDFGRHVNHIDLYKKNNRVENLEWVTRGENAQHAKRAGRYELQHIAGQTLARNNHRRAKKLTLEQVEEIKRLACTGSRKQKDIAIEFGVTQSTVSKIHCSAIWNSQARINHIQGAMSLA